MAKKIPYALNRHSDTLRETVNLPSVKTLGKTQKTLGKDFAECCTQQRTHGREIVGKGYFAECISSGISAVTEQGI
jgi:hypothetical protein